MSKLYTLDDLLYLMACLRDPATGCPWDLKQNYRSITPSTIEEAYEVVDAIEREDYEHLREELGDLLFQVVFYGQLAREEERFTFADVVDDLTAKLIRRHPHVFPDGELEKQEGETRSLDQDAVKESWEAIKAQERLDKGKESVLDDVPLALPAMTRAAKLQKRAAKLGFDWSDSAGVLTKLEEELVELKQAFAAKDQAAMHEELADLLFTCVNMARHLGQDPESLLRSANNKFEARFRRIETRIPEAKQADARMLDSLWQEAKNGDKRETD